MEEKEWVDFKEIKAAVSMQMVLDHYQISGLKKTGDELRGPCPIHKGAPSSRHFCASIPKNAFKCFAADCKARGNVLDFVAAMENCTVRDAALKLKTIFLDGKLLDDPEPRGKHQPVAARGGEEPVADAPVDWLIKLVLQSTIEEIEGEIALLTQQLELKQHRLAELQRVVGL
ncbi:MAG: hypothetical protein H0T92_05005 [Pyrinomonadaceae bacterium]|nr:hypothetical protein [Pyrinomonadaceae bacterium]